MVDLGVEDGPVEIVRGSKARHLILPGKKQPARAPPTAERHVDATHRLEAELIPEHEQIQGDLQACLVVNLRRRGSRARFVVDDDSARAQRIDIDPVDLAADPDTGRQLVRLERHLQLPRDERGTCGRVGPHELLEIAPKALTELAALKIIDVDPEARVEGAVHALVHELDGRLDVVRCDALRSRDGSRQLAVEALQRDMGDRASHLGADHLVDLARTEVALDEPGRGAAGHPLEIGDPEGVSACEECHSAGMADRRRTGKRTPRAAELSLPAVRVRERVGLAGIDGRQARKGP